MAIYYSFLKSILKIFQSNVLDDYLNNFKKFIPAEILDGINFQYGETDSIPEKYNLLSSRISKTRYHDDMVSEIKNYIPLLHSIIKNSYTNQDFKQFINSFNYLTDLSLEHNEIILSERLQKISNEKQNNFDSYEEKVELDPKSWKATGGAKPNDRKYYNNQRFHQGIDKIPNAEIQERSGAINKMKILSGLHHHYYRSSA